MSEIERHFPRQPARNAQRRELPQVVIEADAAAAFFPAPRPGWEVCIGEMQMRVGLLRQAPFDIRAVVFPGDDPGLVLAADRFAHAPAHARLGAVSRLTRVGDDQYLLARR